MIKQIQFIINNGTYVKKKIQEMMKEFDMMNNKNTYAYIKAAVNVMFMYMHKNKLIKLFGEIDIAAMIK